MKPYILSKSTYVRGLQCPKSLWLYKYHYDWQDEISVGQQAVFDTGTSVGLLARDLFPGGVDLSPEYADGIPQFGPAIDKTRAEIDKGTKVLYEAAFAGDQVLAAVDILVRDGEGWRIYEVKSGTQPKDPYIRDACIQYYVLSKAGLKVKDVFVVYVNKNYVRKGPIEVRKLFTMESVLEQAKETFAEMEKNVADFKKVIASDEMPERKVGPHCSDPYACSFTGHCWKGFPEYSVFDLSRIGAKAWDLHAQGIMEPANIPGDYPLSWAQSLEAECARTAKPHVKPEVIREFLFSLSYPLYYFDFETMAPAIPLFNGTSPYQTIAFQYSLHRQDKPGGRIRHTAFLGDGKHDPRETLIRQFLKETKGKGDILMYSGYEKTVLNGLSAAFPKYARALGQRIVRLKDLAMPFRRKAYYSHKMRGSYSIKAVYPALAPGAESYDGLEIADGGTASQAYTSLHFGTDIRRKRKILKDLLAYCRLDTLAMVRIVEKLSGLLDRNLA